MYTAYQQLNEETVIEYTREKLDFFGAQEELCAKELSDGNINFVFRVKSIESGFSVIVKQATRSLRSLPGRALTDQRIEFEVRSLQKMRDVAPGRTPEIYLYDPDMKCCVMEDCHNYRVMRSCMVDFISFPGFGKGIAEYLARLHFYTSDFYLCGADKKKLVSEFINPELCEITERLVFSEPFTDYLDRNTVAPELLSYVRDEIYESNELRIAAAGYKHGFLTSAEALLHGDLHTGSVFINETGFKVFDTEFAFFGPCGYDLGCISGNLLFAYFAARTVGGKDAFAAWALDSVRDIMAGYKNEFTRLAKCKAKDIMLKTDGYASVFVENVLVSAIAMMGAELLRRTVTTAKVADITMLPERAQNIRAQRCALEVGKELVLNPRQYLADILQIREIIDRIQA